MPGKAGQTLTFKALQTYSNGSVVRWIGGPGSEEPAPQVRLSSASASTGATNANAGASAGSNGPVSAPPAAAADNDSNGLGIVALVLGALGLLVGIAALVLARRGAADAGR